MTNRVRAFHELLEEQLGHALETENDFVSLALTGEELRRLAVGAVAGEDSGARVALASYEDRLRSEPGRVPAGLDRDLSSALDALDAVARKPASAREEARTLEVLQGIDEVLCVASAAWRAGGVGEQELSRMASLASDRVSALASSLPEAWNFAADWQSIHGIPPGDLDAFRFWDSLAALSDQESELRFGFVFSKEQRDRLMERAASYLARSSPSGRTEQPAGEIVELRNHWLRKVARPAKQRNGVVFQAPPRQAMAAAADGDDATYPDPTADFGVTIHEDEGVVVRVAEAWLSDAPESVAVVFVRLRDEVERGLDDEGAVRLSTHAGIDVGLLVRKLERRRWMAVFSARGALRLVIEPVGLDLSFTLSTGVEGG